MRLTEIRVAFLGFGTVGRALHALLERRRDALEREYAIGLVVTGVASRRIGWRADATGLDPTRPAGVGCDDARRWLASPSSSR